MLPTFSQLRSHLRTIVRDRERQGHDTAGLDSELDALPDSYDRLAAFAVRLAQLPLRPTWPYREPDDWAGIEAELDPDRPRGPLARLDPAQTARRVESAFLGRVCGC